MSEKANCSFCAKSNEEVEALVAGPAVWICNECADLCVSIFAEKRGNRLRDRLLSRNLQDILEHGT